MLKIMKNSKGCLMWEILLQHSQAWNLNMVVRNNTRMKNRIMLFKLILGRPLLHQKALLKPIRKRSREKSYAADRVSISYLDGVVSLYKVQMMHQFLISLCSFF